MREWFREDAIKRVADEVLGTTAGPAGSRDGHR